MLNGRELLSLLDSDLLEYSNNLDSPEKEVNAWRALCNLHERLTLLMLHAQRQEARHPDVSEHFTRIKKELTKIEKGLLPVLKATKPDASLLRETTDAHMATPVLSPEEKQVAAEIQRNFLANGGRVELNAGDPMLDPIMRGFHAGEENGRWSGPFTSSAIILPVQQLRKIGADTLRLRLSLITPEEMEDIKILLDLDLIDASPYVRHEGRDVVISFKDFDADADRIVITYKRTQSIGEDSRLLGFMLNQIIVEHGNAGQ